jgi:hypothetical protein
VWFAHFLDGFDELKRGDQVGAKKGKMESWEWSERRWET